MSFSKGITQLRDSFFLLCDPLTNVHNRKYLEEHYEVFSLRY